jgi:mannose-6-phosphate isomerase-like protein (cupin superfamily)
MTSESSEIPEIDEGGEAACLAHILPRAPDLPAPIDFTTILSATGGTGPIWSHRSADLDLNLIAITPDRPIASHINTERDVLLVAIAGKGRIAIDDAEHEFSAGQFLVVPKGAQRSMTALSDRFAWLTCHLHRPPLRPGKGPRYRA